MLGDSGGVRQEVQCKERRWGSDFVHVPFADSVHFSRLADKENKRKRKRGGKPQPMTIIGATDEYPNKEGLQFLVKLSNGEKDLISREEMHRLYPQILIDFYESNVKWQEASK